MRREGGKDVLTQRNAAAAEAPGTGSIGWRLATRLHFVKAFFYRNERRIRGQRGRANASLRGALASAAIESGGPLAVQSGMGWAVGW